MKRFGASKGSTIWGHRGDCRFGRLWQTTSGSCGAVGYFSLLPSMTVLRISSEIIPSNMLRILVEPTRENGLQRRSQIMIDKAVTVPRNKVGTWIGYLDKDTLKTVRIALAEFLNLKQ